MEATINYSIAPLVLSPASPWFADDDVAFSCSLSLAGPSAPYRSPIPVIPSNPTFFNASAVCFNRPSEKFCVPAALQKVAVLLLSNLLSPTPSARWPFSGEYAGLQPQPTFGFGCQT
jgi:hypothetical protein